MPRALADTVCSGPKKVSHKPRTSIRTKRQKEMMNKNLSAPRDDKNARQSPNLGQTLEDTRKNQQVMQAVLHG